MRHPRTFLCRNSYKTMGRTDFISHREKKKNRSSRARRGQGHRLLSQPEYFPRARSFMRRACVCFGGRSLGEKHLVFSRVWLIEGRGGVAVQLCRRLGYPKPPAKAMKSSLVVPLHPHWLQVLCHCTRLFLQPRRYFFQGTEQKLSRRWQVSRF